MDFDKVHSEQPKFYEDTDSMYLHDTERLCYGDTQSPAEEALMMVEFEKFNSQISMEPLICFLSGFVTK